MFERQRLSGRWWVACAATLVALACAAASAQPFFPEHCFEAEALPEEFDWQRLPDAPPEGELRIENGWFIQTLGQGDQNFYRMELDPFVGVDRFFVEWRAITDGPSWLIDEGQVPTVVVAGGKGAAFYHTVMTDSLVQLLRDIFLPRAFAVVSVGSPHIYRLEVCANQYSWYIDGVLIETGTAEGPYPDATSRLTWGAQVTYEGAPAATTSWDYVRAGEIPIDGLGDFDVNGYQDMIDYYFVRDCLIKDGPGIVSGPGENAGPGCRFTDFDGDADVDLRDFADFQVLFSEVPCEPFCKEPCWICFPRNP